MPIFLQTFFLSIGCHCLGLFSQKRICVATSSCNGSWIPWGPPIYFFLGDCCIFCPSASTFEVHLFSQTPSDATEEFRTRKKSGTKSEDHRLFKDWLQHWKGIDFILTWCSLAMTFHLTSRSPDKSIHEIQAFSVPATYAVVGMAACLGSICNVPVTSVVLLLELAGGKDYGVVLPTVAATGEMLWQKSCELGMVKMYKSACRI